MTEPVEVLVESQRRARQRLAEARAEARRLRQSQESQALKMLLDRQREAAELLARQRIEMDDSGVSLEQARVLTEQHLKAAQLLSESENVIAVHVADVTEGKIAVVLLQASRDAAAILMEAWVQVRDELQLG